jgi:hypothetical protein
MYKPESALMYVCIDEVFLEYYVLLLVPGMYAYLVFGDGPFVTYNVTRISVSPTNISMKLK